jgi:hypothetical protein
MIALTTRRSNRGAGTTLPLLLALLLVGAVPLASQQGTPPTRGGGPGTQAGAPQGAEARQQMMLRIQREFERQMAQEVELTPEQMDQVRGILARHMTARGEIMRERHQIRVALFELERSQAGEARARELLDRSRALRARELDLQRTEEEALLEVMSPTQVMRLHRFREGWAERIQRLEAEGRMRRGGGPPDGAVPGGFRGGPSR